MYGAWAKNIIIPNFSSIIIPKTLKNLIAQVNFTVQILNKAGHITRLFKSFLQVFDFQFNTWLIPYCKH